MNKIRESFDVIYFLNIKYWIDIWNFMFFNFDIVFGLKLCNKCKYIVFI